MALYSSALIQSTSCYHNNLPTTLFKPSCLPRMATNHGSFRKQIKCSLSLEFEQEDASVSTSGFLEGEEFSHVTKFTFSDFKISDRVSIGLGGRGDEAVFEAIIVNSDSPLNNTKVVLRRLTTSQAQRRGKRAMQVLKKLARRKLMYHSYSMQVHGYVCPQTMDDEGSFTLVHGYHGSFSLRHWLRQADWLPTLEATLALDEESVRRVGDDTVGGPAVSRQLRVIRILMRDLLIGVNYLHSHGLAHTELRLENVHISPVDRHIKVGILGNAADFFEDDTDRQQMMIAFDMRCLGFIMVKMILRELMDPLIFTKFKAFLNKGNDPSCLREFLLRTFNMNSSHGNVGLQMLDRNWGAGWHLLSLLVATRPLNRIRCLEALRHPFLCGPRWRVNPSMDIIRWSLGSTAVRITEEYIYGHQQRIRLAHFLELMEMLNPYSKPKNWLGLLPGRWRLAYCTGRHVGLTTRQPPSRVLIGDVHLTITQPSKTKQPLSFTSDVNFRVLVGKDWPHDKIGIHGKLVVNSTFRLTSGKRHYIKDEENENLPPAFATNAQESAIKKLSGNKWRKALQQREPPSSLPVVKLVSSDIDVTLVLNEPLSKDIEAAQSVVNEVRMQIPPEMFDLSKIVCGTYIDSRMMVLRSVNGSALLFTRVCSIEC
ncbi:putative non-specific serine/threonine protein kinase [Helianthus annuus]|nr:putative non-specific serine/threonine protein kinase [Helianthus annuus]KAJ0533385.1 putative non-specific serine/threonine protein kinase [Helianthus annuus]KAJ0541691.1 putative non-specific serine/threonine protein kinase [Helianthus annuus]KAJ0706765.1 putative non-specific serine/threonine protein kinase [Helianthus annuus]KAJ0710800.1 putative non-specific serine/threonine protein kinase [Helianthus annuus]